MFLALRATEKLFLGGLASIMPVPEAGLLGQARGEVEMPQPCWGGNDTLSLRCVYMCVYVCQCVFICSICQDLPTLVGGLGYFLSFACIGNTFVSKELFIFKVIFLVSFQEVELLSRWTIHISGIRGACGLI